MIGRRIWNSLTQTAQTNLQQHMKKVLWKSDTGEDFFDGPTMLMIIVQAINPSTRVGVTTLKDQIRAINLPGHQHNVIDMFSHQYRLYNEIIQRGGMKKTFGDSVEKSGKTWFWCPHQHNDGKGMYVTHKPEEHTLRK